MTIRLIQVTTDNGYRYTGYHYGSGALVFGRKLRRNDYTNGQWEFGAETRLDFSPVHSIMTGGYINKSVFQ